MDNIVIAQELIYSMDSKKGRMGFMAIKVDLEKAYDRLEWNFIHKVLRAFHFPNQMIKLIMSCISTTSISILLMARPWTILTPLEASAKATHYPLTSSSYVWSILEA